MLFIRRPHHLSQRDADRWVRQEIAPLGEIESVESVELSQLRSAAGTRGSDWDWLIEMRFENVDAAAQAAREEVCRDLVGDLRLLGMQPSLALADGTTRLEG